MWRSYQSRWSITIDIEGLVKVERGSLPANDNRTGKDQTQEEWHQYWRYEPLTKIEFPDVGHGDRPVFGGSARLSVTDSGQIRAVITAAEALSVTMSREISKKSSISPSLHRRRSGTR
jgi:hypothetical protein